MNEPLQLVFAPSRLLHLKVLTPWVHLDIAGTATSAASHELGPSGATGVMVRTLAAMVCSFEAN